MQRLNGFVAALMSIYYISFINNLKVLKIILKLKYILVFNINNNILLNNFNFNINL
jgi:hypothetical protein